MIVASAGAAQGSGNYRLAQVQVEGSKRYPSAQMAQATGLKVGETVNFAVLQKAANRLAATGFFATIDFRYKFHGDTISVTYTVQDTPKLLPCHFANFVWFTRQQLMQDLRAHIPLFEGAVPSAGKTLSEVRARLQAMLAAKGIHAQILYSVQQQVQQLGGHIDGMEFMETGVATPVEKVEFPGAEKKDASQLAAIFHPLLKQNYDASFIQNYANGALRQLYLEHGYLQARVGPPVARLLPGSTTPNAVVVTIPVSRGEQFDLKGIAWSGQSAIPYKKLDGPLHAKLGRPLNEVQLHEQALGLAHLFHVIGYVRADVTSNPILNPATHTAVYQIRIKQGVLYRMGTLEVRGVDLKHAASIRRMCPLHAGDAFRLDAWKNFLTKAFRHLPPSKSGWKVQQAMKFNDTAKTVNIRLTFSSDS